MGRSRHHCVPFASCRAQHSGSTQQTHVKRTNERWADLEGVKKKYTGHTSLPPGKHRLSPLPLTNAVLPVSPSLSPGLSSLIKPAVRRLHVTVSSSLPGTARQPSLFTSRLLNLPATHTPDLGFSGTTLSRPGGFVTAARPGSWRHRYKRLV